MKRLILIAFALFGLINHSDGLSADDSKFPGDAKRVLFLGDSITHAGEFISIIEKELLLQSNGNVPELINLGLPSETCTGLSEPDHPFPRPNVHERIDRALAMVNPDLVIACYGMNDGIYYPFSEERFHKYQQGIREIIRKVNASGAKLILMTPPAFDPLPLKEKGKLLPAGAEKYAWHSIYEDYDTVLKKYSAWLVTLDGEVEMVIDLHTPVSDYVARQRKENPTFTMSPDGVHVNNEGHAVLASAILSAWGIPESGISDQRLDELIGKRQAILHAAWVTHVGHLRPGVKEGLSLEKANAVATELQQQIDDRLIRLRPLLDRNQGKIHHLFYPASKEKGELSLTADFYLWIPPETTHVRGIIVHQHGCGDGASKGGATAANDLHWRELAKKWDCALLGTSIEGRQGTNCRDWCDARNGSADRFVQALGDFSKTTGHPEIAEVPWCLWGHSGGGFWASIMQALYPERIVAIWLQSGQAHSRWTSGEIPSLKVPDAAYGIPVVACPGFKEKGGKRFHVAWDGCLAMFKAYRQQNAPFIFAPDPLTGHECGDSRYLAIPFFDTCLSLRLPDPDAKSQKLKAIDMNKGLFATIDGKMLASIPTESQREETVWLPNAEFAEAWKEFIDKGSVSDKTPPPVPTNARLEKSEAGITKIEWHAIADFESGIAGFKVMQGDRVIAEKPENPKKRFGRPLFQSMSYHDTPEQPLAKMHLELDSDELSDEPITVITVNSVGLESKPVRVKESDVR